MGVPAVYEAGCYVIASYDHSGDRGPYYYMPFITDFQHEQLICELEDGPDAVVHGKKVMAHPQFEAMAKAVYEVSASGEFWDRDWWHHLSGFEDCESEKVIEAVGKITDALDELEFMYRERMRQIRDDAISG